MMYLQVSHFRSEFCGAGKSRIDVLVDLGHEVLGIFQQLRDEFVRLVALHALVVG